MRRELDPTTARLHCDCFKWASLLAHCRNMSTLPQSFSYTLSVHAAASAVDENLPQCQCSLLRRLADLHLWWQWGSPCQSSAAEAQMHTRCAWSRMSPRVLSFQCSVSAWVKVTFWMPWCCCVTFGLFYFTCDTFNTLGLVGYSFVTKHPVFKWGLLDLNFITALAQIIDC